MIRLTARSKRHCGADNVQSKRSDTVDVVSGIVQPKGSTHFHGLWGGAENGRLPLCVQSLQMLPRKAADWLAAVTAGQLFPETQPQKHATEMGEGGVALYV